MMKLILLWAWMFMKVDRLRRRKYSNEIFFFCLFLVQVDNRSIELHLVRRNSRRFQSSLSERNSKSFAARRCSVAQRNVSKFSNESWFDFEKMKLFERNRLFSFFPFCSKASLRSSVAIVVNSLRCKSSNISSTI